jgi:pilus assembly protein Flp/PilA
MVNISLPCGRSRPRGSYPVSEPREKADRRRVYLANSQRRGALHESFMTVVRLILAFSSEVRFVEPGEARVFPENQEVGLSRIFSKFLKDESAATAIEYGLIAAGIALAIIAAVNGLGSTLNDKFTSVSTSLK